MEDYYRRKKRATNMVWTAADNYELEPMYLFYDKKDQPELYSNTCEGLAYRYLDQSIVVPFLEGMEVGKEMDKFRSLALLIMEEAVFLRASQDRPSLIHLRRSYAASHVKEFRPPERYSDLGWERQEILRCYRVLDQDTSIFSKREIQLADAMENAAALPDAEMIAEAKSVFFRFFYYRFTPALKSETADFVGAGMFIVLMSRLMGGRMNTGISFRQDSPGGSEKPRESNRFIRLFKHLLSQTTQDEDWEFIHETFGPCLFSDQQMEGIQTAWCTGYHKKSYLWYCGSTAVDPSLGEEMSRQFRKNREFYLSDQRMYDRNIRHITDHLKHALEEQQEPDVVHIQSGRLDAGRVYRIRAMHDLAVFQREVTFPDPDFTVDLILDASASRRREQESIATQAYIITQSLMNLEIPVQVSCFRSLRGYTILQQMKTYGETGSAEGVFRYFAVGNNRDGLAISAMHPLMNQSGQTKSHRIVLVLTDAMPMDTQKAYIQGALLGQDYDEDLAVEDTRQAVQQLKQEGAHVAAIFWGERHAVPRLKRIYGDSYISIQSITQLPDAVIGLLLRILNHMKDQDNAQ